MKLPILLVAILVLFVATVHSEEEIPQWQSQFVSSSLKYAVIHICAQHRGIASDPKEQSFVGLMHALSLIDTPESLKALVDLSDYYLGEAPGQDLTALITGKGPRIKPLLLEKKKSPLSCDKMELCLSTEDRNRRIDYWIGLIDKGIKVELIP